MLESQLKNFQLRAMNLNTDQLSQELASRGYQLTALRPGVPDIGRCGGQGGHSLWHF